MDQGPQLGEEEHASLSASQPKGSILCRTSQNAAASAHRAKDLLSSSSPDFASALASKQKLKQIGGGSLQNPSFLNKAAVSQRQAFAISESLPTKIAAVPSRARYHLREQLHPSSFLPSPRQQNRRLQRHHPKDRPSTGCFQEDVPQLIR